MGKWEEAQWDKRHLSVDESPETPLAEEIVKADNWSGASNKGLTPRHLPWTHNKHVIWCKEHLKENEFLEYN